MDRRHVHVHILVVMMLFLLIYLVGHSYASRHIISTTNHRQVFKVKPNKKVHYQALPPTFFSFLPKAMPIPPSGPSRKHNAIGLQASLGTP
ncbi:hypothetical protein HN51_029800 [Arachis hypogaea]